MQTVVVFVKWPEPGRVKTRLIPRLGAVGAAECYRAMAERVVRQIAPLADHSKPPASATPTQIVGFFDPSTHGAEFAAWLGPIARAHGAEMAWWPQPTGTLTPRLIHAFDRAFAANARRVIAIGTDCVGVDAALLGEAFGRLESADAAIGPALDGGYYLIGLSRPLPTIFENIPWSAPATLAATRQALAACGAVVAPDLPVLQDIDEPADLLAQWPERLEN